MKIRLADPGLPVHPFTGLTALGLRRNGAPIWPVKGGSEDGDGDGDQDGDSDGGDGAGDGDADQLGDAGKKALDAMKAKWQRERDSSKPWKSLAREHGVSTPEELIAKLSGKKDDADQADADKVRREADAEATAKANRKIVRAEVKAAAAGKFADPADAVAFLNLDEFEVDDEGEVDQDALNEALAELLKKKPHLAAQGGRRFAGGGDGGHRGDAPANVPPGVPRLAHAYATASKTKTNRT
jgi:hypothetical protein